MAVGPIVHVVLALAFAAGPGAVAPPRACAPSSYRPPVVAPVAAPFSLPNGPFGAGNRGIEYRTAPGQPVRVIGAGTIRFAGTVAGERFVSVAHPDGLISSYSYLASSTVVAGRAVVAGAVIGTTTARFQLGIRRAGEYLDPAALLGPSVRPRLVGPTVGPPSTACTP